MLPLLLAVLAASPSSLVVANADGQDPDAPSAHRLRNRRFPIEVGGGVSLHGRERDSPYAGPHLRAVATLPFGMTVAADAAYLHTPIFSETVMVGGSLGYAFTPGQWLIRPYVGGGYSKTVESGFFGIYEIRDAGHLTVGVECLIPTRIFGFAVEGGGLKTYAGTYFNTWEWRGWVTGVMTWYFV